MAFIVSGGVTVPPLLRDRLPRTSVSDAEKIAGVP